MSQGRGFDFKEEVKKRFLALTATKPALAGGLSVNSLSLLSDRFVKLGRGDTIKRISFWIAFFLCAWFVADLLSLLVEKYLPSPPVSILANRTRNSMAGSNPMDYEIIANRNLFSSKAPSKTKGDEIDMDAEPVPTTLSLQLIGTVIFKNPSRSLGALQDKNDSKLYPVRAGDEIMDGRVQIISVDARRVVFVNFQARRKEFVELPEEAGSKITMGTSFARSAPAAESAGEVQKSIQGTEIDNALGNFGALLTQARAVPVNRGGQMIGFQLVELQPGSFYEKVGMKKEDIIKGVDGEKISDPAKAMQLVQDLKNKSALDLTIERGGKDITIHYDIRR